MSYLVRAADSRTALLTRGAEVESTHETLAEAKDRAKTYVSPGYARAAEMRRAFGYACVMKGDELVFERGS